MIGARGEQQQGLGRGRHRFFKNELAQALGKLGAAGLASNEYIAALLGPQQIGDELHMTRFTGAVHPFQRDESPLLAHRFN